MVIKRPSKQTKRAMIYLMYNADRRTHLKIVVLGYWADLGHGRRGICSCQRH